MSEKEIREKAQIIVANDLKTWQEKFAKAADEGSDELDERINEITDRLIKNQAEKVGPALNIELEETIKSSFKSLKSSIISILKNSKDTEQSEEELNTAVRKAGVAIKEKAQAVRTWRQNYDKETNSLVSKAAEDTFQILDHIRDLGLQEIGMRWAWTDGITHKDWTKYHSLKPKYDEWRQEVELVAINHPGLGKARAASEEVESRAMGTAEEAAKELARLKETGRWKISTGDLSDDWTTKMMPAAAMVAGQKVVDKLREASEAVVGSTVSSGSSIASSVASSISSSILGTPQGSVESVVSAGSATASSLADQASSSILGTQQGSVESASSVAKASASSIVDQASSSIIGTQQGSAESFASVAKESASSIVDHASSSAIGTSTGSVESMASVASESASSLSAKASSSIVGTEPGFVEKVSSSAQSAASVVSGSASSLSDTASSLVSQASTGAPKVSSSISSISSSASSSISKGASDATSLINSSVSSAASTASKKVWGGAMAQSVEAKQIVYEDIIDDSPDNDSYSEKIQSMASEVGDQFGEITKAVSEALLKPSSTLGAVESVTSLAAEQYSIAFAAASSALYGTEQGTGESLSSVASSRYSDAVSA